MSIMKKKDKIGILTKLQLGCPIQIKTVKRGYNSLFSEIKLHPILILSLKLLTFNL